MSRRFSVLFLFCITLLDACHTRLHSPGRVYRNLTAFYNTYFNAKEIYALSIKKVNLSNPDRFDRLLAFYKPSGDISSPGLTLDMDQVVKKCSALIVRHEKSDLVSSAYLLMGKAYYLKGDFTSALENFQYVYNTFADDTLKVAALVWTARANLALGKVSETQQALDLALSAGEPAKRKNGDELYSTAARLALTAKDTLKSIQFLKKAIMKKSEQKSRFAFIIGQLNYFKGEQDSSLKWFSEVLKYHPSFELEFGARLGIASSSSNITKVTSSLYALAKAEKSREYLDQIYYTLGRLKQKARPIEALKLYRQSLNFNTSNGNQRGLDYLRTSEIYLSGQKDYTKAAIFQDSAITYIDKDYPGYAAMLAKKQKLSSLTGNYQVIEDGDTLLILASLDEQSAKQKARQTSLAKITKRKAEELASVEAFKKQLNAAGSQFASQTNAAGQIGSALNRPEQTNNSLLLTTGSYSSSSLSTYQPSATNQSQFYAQGASTATTGQAFGGGASGSSGGSSSYGSSGGSGYGGSTSYGGSGPSGGFAGGTGGISGGIGGSGATGTPQYNASSATYNRQQTTPQVSQPPGAGVQNSVPTGTQGGGVGLYGGQSFNTTGRTSSGATGAFSGGSSNAQVPNGSPGSSGLPGGDGIPGVNLSPASPTVPGSGTGSSGSALPGNGVGLAAQRTPNNTGAPEDGNGLASQQNGSSGYGSSGFGSNEYGGVGGGPAGNQGGYPARESYGGSSSTFYFSNAQTLSQGYGRFIRLWGNRSLKDNWRRSNGGDFVPGGEERPAVGTAEVQGPGVQPKTKLDEETAETEALMRRVPRTDLGKDSVRTTQLAAFESNAAIYDADLHDVPAAVSTYREAIKRFPGRTASFMFELYKLHRQVRKTASADSARRYLTTRFPESIYAKYFTHPEELIPKSKIDTALESYYSASYRDYQDHKYSNVITRSKAIPKADSNYLADKFEFLRVLSIGNTKGLTDFEPQLKSFLIQYSGSPLAVNARTLLAQLDSNRDEYAIRMPVIQTPKGMNGFAMAQLINESRERAALAELDRKALARKKFFSNNMKGPFQFLALLSAKKMNMRPVKLGVSQLDAAEFGRLNLSNEVRFSVGNRLSVRVGAFRDLRSALSYYRRFDQLKGDLIPASAGPTEIFIISEENEVKLTGDEPLTIYREFFQDEVLPYLMGKEIKEVAKKADSATSVKKRTNDTKFSASLQGPWMVSLIVSDLHTGLNPTRLQISLYNRSAYPSLKLHHESALWPGEAQVVSIAPFSDFDTAKTYLEKFASSLDNITSAPKEKRELIVVSSANFEKLHTLQDLAAYQTFYNAELSGGTGKTK